MRLSNGRFKRNVSTSALSVNVYKFECTERENVSLRKIIVYRTITKRKIFRNRIFARRLRYYYILNVRFRPGYARV